MHSLVEGQLLFWRGNGRSGGGNEVKKGHGQSLAGASVSATKAKQLLLSAPSPQVICGLQSEWIHFLSSWPDIVTGLKQESWLQPACQIPHPGQATRPASSIPSHCVLAKPPRALLGSCYRQTKDLHFLAGGSTEWISVGAQSWHWGVLWYTKTIEML
jgi:hypothetical protein